MPLCGLEKPGGRNMAFFDEIGKKITDAGAKTFQKGKEFSDAARLNAQISEEQAKINNLYYQIGKLYVTVHRADNEEMFRGMIASIDEAENNIQQWKATVEELRGVQRCEKCGAEVPRGAAFCSVCGNPMAAQASAVPEGFVQCMNCGAQVRKDMLFCTTCGKPMAPQVPFPAAPVQQPAAPVYEQPVPAPQPVPVYAAPAAPAEPAVPSKKFCPNCGVEMPGDAMFCAECGMRF